MLVYMVMSQAVRVLLGELVDLIWSDDEPVDPGKGMIPDEEPREGH
ncbi:hypothetical protein AB0I72_27545 [Nocardiopsis sp. NPDC049922]